MIRQTAARVDYLTRRACRGRASAPSQHHGPAPGTSPPGGGGRQGDGCPRRPEIGPTALPAADKCWHAAAAAPASRAVKGASGGFGCCGVVFAVHDAGALWRPREGGPLWPAPGPGPRRCSPRMDGGGAGPLQRRRRRTKRRGALSMIMESSVPYQTMTRHRSRATVPVRPVRVRRGESRCPGYQPEESPGPLLPGLAT